MSSSLPVLPMLMVLILPLLIAWSLVWKGWSLWVAARKGSKPWFIALLILNTCGILDILYIFWFSRNGEEKNDSEKVNNVGGTI